MAVFSVVNAMSYSCTHCDAQFQSAASVSQHVGLHHDTCAACDEQFGDTDSLRDHIHQSH